MIIKYVGNKPKMTINYPIGSGNLKSTKKILFSPGATYEFSDEDGQKLLDLDFETLSLNDISKENLAKTSQVTKLSNGSYRFQFNFVKMEDKNDEEEKEKEETSLLKEIKNVVDLRK